MNHKYHLHKIVLTILFLPLITLTAQCSKKPSEPLRIGYIGCLSKKFASMGGSGRDGAILAVEEINAGGGINGRNIELVIRDDGGDPREAAEIATELADSGIRIIVGPFMTASGTAILPVINKRQVLTISPTTAGKNLEDKDDYYIKLVPSTEQFGEKLGEVFLQLDGGKVVAIFDRRNERYCTSLVSSFRAVLGPQDDSFIDEISFYSNRDVSYSKKSDEVLAQSPDSTLICASPIDTAILSQHLKRKQPSLNLWSSPWGISPELVQNGGSAVEGLIFVNTFFHTDQPERFSEFAGRYRQRFKRTPSFVAMANYEAIKILFEAILESSSDTPEEIKKALLEKEKFMGLQYEITVDAEGDGWRPIIPHTVKMGAFQKIDVTDYP